MQPFEIRVPAATMDRPDNRGSSALPELLLSAPTAEDTERITEICQDPEIQRWTTVPSPYTRQDAELFVKNLVPTGYDSDQAITLAVRERSGEDGTFVLVGLLALRIHGAGRASVGYWLAPEARGRGTIHRATDALLALALDPEGPLALTAVEWSCDVINGVPNWDSWRVAWSLGFRREGLLRRRNPNKGELRDALVGSLLAGEPRRPVAPWDGPARRGAASQDDAAPTQVTPPTPLTPHDGVGEREGDDPEALVRRFHHVYGLPVQTDGPSLDRASLSMRMSLIAEEFSELVGSVYGAAAREQVEAAYERALAADDGSRDVVETADALADLVYVIYGMALETGIDLAAVLAEVQRSNMSKLGQDGRPIYREDGKVLKGPGYFRPDVAGVLGVSD